MDYEEITDPARLMEMANAFRVSRIILTANELGVFDLLTGTGRDSASVAERLGSHPKATNRLLNALVALGLLNQKQETFSNTPFSNTFLVRESPDFLQGLSLSNQTWRTWSTLTEAVFAGTTVAMTSPINERTDEWRNSFIAAMHARAGLQAQEVATILDLGNTRTMLDVGGGSGAFAFAMIRKNPAIRATIFDLPNIIPLTTRYIQSSGLETQVNTIVGNYLEDDLGSGFDLVLMSAILHINSPEENLVLLRKGVSALHPMGQLVVLDHIMDDTRTRPAVGAFFALNMLVGTLHGDTYTEKEVRTWMQEADLADIKMLVTPTGNQLMVGRKK